MSSISNVVTVVLKTTLRDKVVHALLICGALLFMLVPSFSLFSMRQVQELSITLSLSAISFILLLFTVVLGSSSIWRDVERRYTTSVLGLPISRASFVVGKFFGTSFFIVACAVLLGAISSVAIFMSAGQYKSDLPIVWVNIYAAIVADALKYILLLAVALLFSSLSTSFFFPFFTTISIYLAGSASQEVAEYIAGEYGAGMSPVTKGLTKFLYYLLPNFSAFNLKVYAIYSLPLPAAGLVYTLIYFVVYTALLVLAAIWVFSRRELP